MRSTMRPNFGVKLVRPASARQPSCLPFRQHDGVTAVAVRQSWLRNSSAATAAPLRLRRAEPAVQLTPRTLGGLKNDKTPLFRETDGHGPTECQDQIS